MMNDICVNYPIDLSFFIVKFIKIEILQYIIQIMLTEMH